MTKVELKAQIDEILSGITSKEVEISELEDLLGEDYTNDRVLNRQIDRLKSVKSILIESLAVPTAQYTIADDE